MITPRYGTALFTLTLAGLTAGQTTTAPEAQLAPTPAEPGDQFGDALAIDADTLVVGAPGGLSAEGGGAAYVFVRSGSTWLSQAYLKASNPDPDDRFGASVAIDGDTIVVGAEGEDSQATGIDGDQADNSAPSAGAAYVFTRTGTVWSQQAYLKAADTESIKSFGDSVAVEGDTAAVGAPSGPDGDVYVFTRSGSTWQQETQLTRPSSFGRSVALAGDTLLVGSPTPAGQAFVFVRSGTLWSQQASLVGSNTEDGDLFGFRLALDGDTAAIGAQGEDSASTGVDGDQLDNSVTFAGAAYVFRRSGTSWTQEAYLKAATNTAFGFFGFGIAVSGDRIVIGARGDDGAGVGVNPPYWTSAPSSNSNGAAYVFARTGTTWALRDSLKSGPNPPGGFFGNQTAVDGARAYVGAPANGSSGTVETFAFDVPIVVTPYCTAKASAAGCLAEISSSDLTAQPVSGAADYYVYASNVQGSKPGLLYGGTAAANTPFLGGTLCVEPPLKRGSVFYWNAVDPNGCDGVLAQLVNDGAVLPGGLDAGRGNSAWYQFWYRSPDGVHDVAFSDAVQLDFQ